MHSNNIIHHDIKCENIFLDTISGQLKIGCIGSIEQLPEGFENFGKYLGTAEFMAPEVNEGHYSFKSDIYSLGLTLIELLTVQIPYKECEGALNIYINKKKGILPESFKLITDSGIRDFIMLCLSKENKRPTAKELLEKNEWLNDKTINRNNTIIEIKGSLRQRNFYLNNKYKSGGFIAMQKTYSSSKNIIKYSSKMFNAFNIKTKKSWDITHNKSGKIKNKVENNNNEISSSFSFKKNVLFTKSTTSRTDNLISNRSYHNQEEDNNDINLNINNIVDDCFSNNSNINSSRDHSTKNLINLNAIKFNYFNKNDSVVNKPIIKDKNKVSSTYGMFQSSKDNRKKFVSPDNKKKKIVIPHLNFGSIQNNVNNMKYPKINSFRESIKNEINNINNNSSIKSISLHYNEEKYDECYDFDINNSYYINYNIIYTIKFFDDKVITCEYNYEKDTVDIIIKHLKEIINLDANDIVLIKNEFGKKIQQFMDKKKLKIFFNKYYLVLNKFKLSGNLCKKFDKIISDKNIKNFNHLGENKLNSLMEKIKDYQMKKIIVNNINNSSKK